MTGIDLAGGSGVDPAAVRPEVVQTIVRTLMTSGFRLVNTNRQASAILLQCNRVDEFGVEIRYLVVICDSVLRVTSLEPIRYMARRNSSHLVVVGESEDPTIPCLTWDAFLARFGGPVRSWLPLEPTYASSLSELGHNRVVSGLVGTADDLFEEFVHAGLQFLMPDRVIRYGQERRFEKLPYGLGFTGHGLPYVVYDAKASGGGYSVTAESMRQFGEYINIIRKRYAGYFSEPHAFLLISGSFADGIEARRNRRDELYADYRVPLTFMEAPVLSGACELFASNPQYRSTVDWGRLLSHTDITLETIETELRARRRDGLIRDMVGR